MTIQEAIIRLQEAMNVHGPATPVYFDCPTCGHSFTPDRVVTQALHLKPEKTKG